MIKEFVRKMCQKTLFSVRLSNKKLNGRRLFRIYRQIRYISVILKPYKLNINNQSITNLEKAPKIQVEMGGGGLEGWFENVFPPKELTL